MLLTVKIKIFFPSIWKLICNHKFFKCRNLLKTKPQNSQLNWIWPTIPILAYFGPIYYEFLFCVYLIWVLIFFISPVQLNWDFWGFVLKTHEEFVIWRNPNFSSSIHSGFLPIFTRLRRSASLNDEKHLPPPYSIQGGGTMRGERQGVKINYFLNLKSWFFWNDICEWKIKKLMNINWLFKSTF